MRAVLMAGTILVATGGVACASHPPMRGPYIAACMAKLPNVNLAQKRDRKPAYTQAQWARTCDDDYAAAVSIHRPMVGDFSCFPLVMNAAECARWRAAHP